MTTFRSSYGPLSHQPDLALHVMSMQLMQGKDCQGEHPMVDRVAAQARLMQNSLRELLNDLRVPTWTANNAELQLQWPMYYDQHPGNWLTALALALTPRLESLLLAIGHVASFDSSLGRPPPRFQFPHLQPWDSWAT